MAGLIQQQQGAGATITPDSVRSKMNVPANLQSAYLAIVGAGRKILYSPQMAPQIQALLKSPGDISDKLGQGVAAILAMIYGQTNHTMPKQLIIPAGTELVVQAADLLRKSGVQVTDQDIANAIKAMIQIIMQKMGVTPQALQQAVAQQQSSGSPNAIGANASAPPSGAPAPAAAPQPAQE